MKNKYCLKEGKLKSYSPLHQGHSEMYRKRIMKFNKKNHYSILNGKGYYLDNNKLYVAGTFGKNNIISSNDILSDITIPFGLSSYSQRYRDISDILDENHNISEVISHSLGSSASAKYLQNIPDRNIRLTTYGAPFVSMSNKK